MPVKIKHKQLSETKEVSFHTWEFDTNKSNWELISITNLVELYNSKTGEEVWQTTLELEDAINAVNKHPNYFRFEISDKNTHFIDLKNENLPKAYPLSNTINKTKKFLSKNIVKKSILFIIDNIVKIIIGLIIIYLAIKLGLKK